MKKNQRNKKNPARSKWQKPVLSTLAIGDTKGGGHTGVFETGYYFKPEGS